MAEQFEGWDSSDAAPVSSSPVPLEGIYPEVEVQAVIWKDSARHKGKKVFIVELLIHRSMVDARPPGTPMGIVRAEGDYGVTNLYGQVKTILGEILSKPATAVTKEEFAASFGAENPHRGKRFGLIATRKNEDKEWCMVKFVPVMSADYEAKLRSGRVHVPQIEAGSKDEEVVG